MDAAKTATIVIVEDEAVIADALAVRLRAEGFAVEVASDGLRGVELCDRIAPDLVVLDVMLPGIDGHEVCRRIQRDRPVPVLMLTARRRLQPRAAASATRSALPARGRTPLGALQAVFENVVDGVSEPDPDTLRTMLAQTRRLGRLVTQLLDLARLEAGEQPFDMRPFALRDILEGAPGRHPCTHPRMLSSRSTCPRRCGSTVTPSASTRS